MVLEVGAMAQFSTAQSRIEIYSVKSTHNLIRSSLLQQARSTESLEINGLRKVIRFCHSVRVCESPRRFDWFQSVIKRKRCDLQLWPGSILQGSVENQVARCDHARLSISILSQVTENSAIEFVVLRSETVFTAVLASVSLNYRST